MQTMQASKHTSGYDDNTNKEAHFWIGILIDRICGVDMGAALGPACPTELSFPHFAFHAGLAWCFMVTLGAEQHAQFSGFPKNLRKLVAARYFFQRPELEFLVPTHHHLRTSSVHTLLLSDALPAFHVNVIIKCDLHQVTILVRLSCSPTALASAELY